MIVAGFGFRAGVTVDSLSDAYQRASAGQVVDKIATADDKAQSDAFRQFADTLGLPVAAIPPLALAAQSILTRSQASSDARNTGSVAEAAALAAAGPTARLVAARVISTDRMATCALALGDIQ